MNTPLHPEDPIKTPADTGFMLAERTEARYFHTLVGVVTGLFVGVLALMTFMLMVGVQRPHPNLAWSLYASVGLLALNLIAYVAGHMFQTEMAAQFWAYKTTAADDAGGDDAAKLKAKLKAAKQRLKITRFIQQLLFVAAVVAVAALAVFAANLFFSIPAAAAMPAQ